MSHPLPLVYERRARLAAVPRLLWLVVPGAIAGAALAAAASLLVAPTYRAAAMVEFVQPIGSAPLSDAARDARIDSIVETARSLPLALAVVATLDLTKDHELHADTAAAEGNRQAIALALMDHLRAERIGATNLVRIEAASGDASRAANLADGVTSALIARAMTDRLRDIAPPGAAVQRDLAALRQRAETADLALATFRSRTASSAATNAVEGGQEVDGLRASLSNARGEAAAASARATAANGETVVQASSVGQNGTTSLAQLRTERAEVARRVALLADRYDADYPLLESARIELATLDEAITTEFRALSGSAQADASAARARADALAAGLGNAEARRARAIGGDAQLARLQRDADAARDALHQLQASVAERGTERSVAQPELRLAAPAAAPLTPSSPDRPLMALFGALAGAAAAAAIALRPKQHGRRRHALLVTA